VEGDPVNEREQRGTRRPRAGAEAPTQEEQPPSGGQTPEAQTQETQPPDGGQTPEVQTQEEPEERAEDELPVERLLGDDAELLVAAPGHEVAGALAYAGIDKTNITVAEVEQALEDFRSFVPNDSTHLPEDQEA
jgi:hypothetical protein